MRARESVSDVMLEAFRLMPDRETVRWATADELAAAGKMSKRKLPYGKPAGSKPVLGRGLLIRYMTRYLLSSDVSLALSSAVVIRARPQLWFNAGMSPPEGDPSPDDARQVELIRSTWFVDDRDVLRWTLAPHSTIGARAEAEGTILAGRGDVGISLRGWIYVSSDVRHVLKHGHLPWQPAPRPQDLSAAVWD